MRGDTRATDSMFLKLSRIGSRDQRHHNAAFLYHAIRTRERVFAYWVEYHVHIFGDVFKLRLGVIHGYIGAELLEKVLVCCRRGGDDPRTARFGDLHRETADST